MLTSRRLSSLRTLITCLWLARTPRSASLHCKLLIVNSWMPWTPYIDSQCCPETKIRCTDHLWDAFQSGPTFPCYSFGKSLWLVSALGNARKMSWDEADSSLWLDLTENRTDVVHVVWWWEQDSTKTQHLLRLMLRLPDTVTLFDQHSSSICLIHLSVFRSTNKVCGKSQATTRGSGLGLTWQFCFSQGLCENLFLSFLLSFVYMSSWARIITSLSAYTWTMI